MFERSTGLNILLDEISFGKQEWSLAPKYVSMALTNACELHCHYCYAPKTNAKLAYGSVISWANELDQQGCLAIGFGGGEPTLYPDFAGLCCEVQRSTNLAVSMTTHGHQFSTTLSKKLAGGVNFIRVSMDGIHATYEHLRGRSFRDFCSKLPIIRDTAPFGINFVLNDDTAADLPEAADFAFAQGAFEFLVLPQLGTDGSPQVSAETIALTESWMTGNYQRLRIACSARGAELFAVPILPISDPLFGDREFLHIDAKGFLRCSAFTDSGVQISSFETLTKAIDGLRAL